MKVVDLNEFLRRAQKAGILSSLLLEFRRGTYNMGTGLLQVSIRDGNSGALTLTDERGSTYGWGIDFESGSSEIIDLRKTSSKKLIGGSKILVKLGKKCSSRGEV